jgi:hypothetical protein
LNFLLYGLLFGNKSFLFMPMVFFSNSARPFSLGSVSASTTSAYCMNAELELAKLMAAFEVLMIVCAACVLRSSIGFMWSRSAMLSLCIFIGVFLLVLLTSVGLFWSSGSPDDASMSTRFVNIGGCTTSKKLKYTAIDV